MKWQTYQFPLEIESSSRKQSAIFDSINQNETKRTHERRGWWKKGRKNKHDRRTFLKKENRNGWVQVEKWEWSVCMQSPCLCLCNVYRTLLHLRSDEVERPNWCHSDCVRNKWPHFFTLSPSLTPMRCWLSFAEIKAKNPCVSKIYIKTLSIVWNRIVWRISWIVSQPVSIHFINLKYFPGRDTSIIIYWLFLFGLLSFWFRLVLFLFLVCCWQHTDAHKHFLCPSTAGSLTSLDQFECSVNCFISSKYV